MEAKNLRKIVEQLGGIRDQIEHITDQLSDNQVKFSWYCRKCKQHNNWEWFLYDYEPWTETKLICEHCSKSTKVAKQPKQI